MSGPRDLFGQRLTVAAIGSLRSFARTYYWEADALPPGPERSELFRLAARAQRLAERREAKATLTAEELAEEASLSRDCAQRQGRAA